jgi:uncharacterized protein
MSRFQFRVATQSDFPEILALNQQSEQFLSPLDLPKLVRISNEASFFQVAIAAESVAGFLLAFLPQADYDNPNFLWFKTRYKHFIYIDRVVISEDSRGHHLATHLYADLRAQATARGIPRLVCEIHIDPPNPRSLRFHEKEGFIEVGRQTIFNQEENNQAKIVSLQINLLN